MERTKSSPRNVMVCGIIIFALICITVDAMHPRLAHAQHAPPKIELVGPNGGSTHAKAIANFYAWISGGRYLFIDASQFAVLKPQVTGSLLLS